MATSVSTAQIQDLPVASRRWIDLALLVPGVSKDNIRGQFYLGTVNIGAGTREYSNMYIVDGVNNTWQEMGEPRQNFAMDSIQEFKVSTSTYKAEYGLATGGVLTVFSKSGTNTFHGSGLLFMRDKSLTAREFFQTEKPDYSRYRYGGTIGGPIIKDRTHFFYAYERTDEKPYLTVNTRGIWPQYDGTYLQPSEPVDLDGEGRSSVERLAVALPPMGARERVPPDRERRRHDRAERRLRLLGAAQLAGDRPHVDRERSRAERFPLPVRLRQQRSRDAVQPRRMGGRRFQPVEACTVHAAVQLPVGQSRIVQQPDGP